MHSVLTTTGFVQTKAWPTQYTWLGPKSGSDCMNPAARGLEDLRHAGRLSCGDEAGTHGIEVDFDDFERSGSCRIPSRRHAVYHADGFELSAEARQQSRGCRRRDSDRERWLCGTRAGPGCTGSQYARTRVRASVAQGTAVLPLTRNGHSAFIGSAAYPPLAADSVCGHGMVLSIGHGFQPTGFTGFNRRNTCVLKAL